MIQFVVTGNVKFNSSVIDSLCRQYVMNQRPKLKVRLLTVYFVTLKYNCLQDICFNILNVINSLYINPYLEPYCKFIR